jgi:hypothetical protein
MTSPGNYKANNDGSRRDSEDKGKDSNVRGNRQVVFRNLKIKRHIIKKRSDD